MYQRQDELERALREQNFEMIEEIVRAQCHTAQGDYFSGFIGVFAEAIILLCERGRLELITDNGGRVVSAADL